VDVAPDGDEVLNDIVVQCDVATITEILAGEGGGVVDKWLVDPTGPFEGSFIIFFDAKNSAGVGLPEEVLEIEFGVVSVPNPATRMGAYVVSQSPRP